MRMLKVTSLGTLLALLLLAGCAIGDGPAIQASKLLPTTPAASTPVQEDSARTVLRTSMPALASFKAGDEFEFQVSADLASPLYQGCGRVAYDPRQLEPMRAERGALLPAGYVFIAPLDSSKVEQSTLPTGMAVVPFAFTGTPGQAAIPAQSGVIMTVRFRVKQPLVAASRPVYLLNSVEHLQLRDTSGVRMAFDLASQEVQR
jgi:hypothetical protein